MSESLLYILVFAGLMFLMHRGHGGMAGCGGGHVHRRHPGTTKEDSDMMSPANHNEGI